MEHKHKIDRIFPIALFFVFISSCFIVLILAIHSYKDVVSLSDDNYQSRVVLSYLTQKVHQCDSSSTISLEHIEQKDVLVLKYNQDYTTYIYEDEGNLKELFLSNQVPIDLKSGKTIMPVSHLKMQQVNAHLYRFSCLVNHKKVQTSVSVQSR